MFLFPKNAKYTKSFSSKKLFAKNSKNSTIKFNRYACMSLIAMQAGKITNYQHESIRRFLRRFLKKKARVFFNTSPNIPITKKPNDVRQGRGKGPLKYWVKMLKKGDVLLEIRSLDNNFTRKILTTASLKLNIKTCINERRYR